MYTAHTTFFKGFYMFWNTVIKMLLGNNLNIFWNDTDTIYEDKF